MMNFSLLTHLNVKAGLREVYFGSLLNGYEVQQDPQTRLFTEYVEHFFGENGELWIVFRDAGQSLRNLMYTGTDAGDYVVYSHSWLWTLVRMSLAKKADNQAMAALSDSNEESKMETSTVGRQLMGSFLRQVGSHVLVANLFGSCTSTHRFIRHDQILEAAATLNENGIIHRDIKPANGESIAMVASTTLMCLSQLNFLTAFFPSNRKVMCKSNLNLDRLQSLDADLPEVHCVLGDFSSAYNMFTSRNLYTRGPSQREQTDEYAPPEAIFGHAYNDSGATLLTPAFDSWSIGIIGLELLLGTPNVFSVDQRTRCVGFVPDLLHTHEGLYLY